MSEYLPNYSVKPEPPLLPCNLELEQAYLGALLINNEVLDVTDEVDADYFYDPVHQRIFARASEVITGGDVANPVTLKRYFEDEDMIGEMTVPQYLGHLIANATTVINAPGYARELFDLYIRRQIVIITNEAKEEAYNGGRDASLLLDDIEGNLFGLHDDKSGRKSEAFGVIGARVVNRIVSGEREDFIPTGLIDLDRKIGGLRAGELTVIGGRTSMGKSTLAQSLAFRMAKNAGVGVGIFSLEMSADQLMFRWLADALYHGEGSITYQNLRDGKIETYQAQQVADKYEEIKNLPMIVDDRSGISMAQIYAGVRKMKRDLARMGVKLQVVVIDYLGIIQSSNRYAGNRVYEIGELSAAAKVLARNLGVAVILVHQINRQAEQRSDKRPTLADLRDSGNIEQDADVIFLVFRAEYYLERMKCEGDEEIKRLDQLEREKNIMEINVAKQRNGPCGFVNVRAFMAQNAIRNMHPGQ